MESNDTSQEKEKRDLSFEDELQGDANKILIDKVSSSDILVLLQEGIRIRSDFSAPENAYSLLHQSLSTNQLGSDLERHIAGNFRKIVCGVFDLLEPVGFAFGYRVTNEMAQYMASWINFCTRKNYSVEQIKSGYLDVLDATVLMKMLPKIHGNQRQLVGSLRALADFLNGKESYYQLGNLIVKPKELLDFRLLRSAEKATELDNRLNTLRYTTFIS